MATKDLIVSTAKTSAMLLKMTLGDFSEADMLARPVPAANHTAWQMSHLLNSAAFMLTAFKTPAVPLPPLVPGVDKKVASSNDPALFAKKDELLTAYDAVIAAIGVAVADMDDAALAKPSPEAMVKFAPTLADLAILTPLHTNMHIGQFQVIRRALGKPVLF